MDPSRALRNRIERAIKDWQENGYIRHSAWFEGSAPRQRLPRPIDVMLSSQLAECAIGNLDDAPPAGLVQQLELAKRWLCCQASKKDVAEHPVLSIPNYPPLHAATAAVRATLAAVIRDKPALLPSDFSSVDLAAKEAHISHLLATGQVAAYRVAESRMSEQRETVSERFSTMIKAFFGFQLSDQIAISLLEAYEAGSKETRGAWMDRMTETGLAAELSGSVATVFA